MKSIRQLFDEEIPQRLKEDPSLLQRLNLKNQSVCLDVTGAHGGAWVFDFDAEGNSTIRSSNDSSSSCVIQMKDKTFQGILDGSVNVPMAFVMRKIKVKGDKMVAAKLGESLRRIFM